MANWTVALDSHPVVEPPNAVAYVTYSSDDNRQNMAVRVTYEDESSLLNYLASECARLSALDDRLAQMQAVVAGTALIPAQQITLPDISEQEAVVAAQAALNLKVATALVQRDIEAATAIDASITDAQAAVATAQSAVSIKLNGLAQPAQLSG